MSDSVTPWTVARQAPLSIGFPRQQYWSRLPVPSPGDLPNPGIELMSPELAGGFFTVEPPGRPITTYKFFNFKKIPLKLPFVHRLVLVMITNIRSDIRIKKK